MSWAIPKWVVRAAAAQLLSRVPGGPRARYLIQLYVTRSLPFPDAELLARFQIGCQHLDAVGRHAPSLELGKARFFEFGSGWDLGLSLFFCAAGVGTQTLVDLNRFARPPLVAHALARLRAFVRDPSARQAFTSRVDLARVPERIDPKQHDLDQVLSDMGIEYRAPSDARATGLSEGYFDCVTSSLTLEHICLDDIHAIFREMRRILRPGGLFVSKIDLSDHYSHSDPALGPYHFLRLSEPAWRFANADMLYQNRLRSSAFERVARESGFEILEATRSYPDDIDPKTSPLPPVHPSYTAYDDRDDLLAHRLYLVLRRPEGHSG